MLRRLAWITAPLTCALLLSACSADDAGSATSPAANGAGRITVVTDVYPTAYAAAQIGGEAVDVVLLTQPGVEPHDLELSADQVRQIADADLVAYIPGLVPAVQDAAQHEAADRAVDVTSKIRLRPDDPHVWLDPRNVSLMGQTIAEALTARQLGSTWASAELDAAMATLDTEFRTALTPCRVRTLVVSHAAFGYLADAYDFEQAAIAGLSPEAEPSPAHLAELTRLVTEKGVTTVYIEPLAPPDAGQALASEAGVRTAVLDPVEGSTDGRSYPELMRANLSALTAGQECT